MTVIAMGFEDSVRSVLSGRRRRTLDDPKLTCAAVLVPLVCKDGEWHVVVTQRTQTVEVHSGQISFPGGACDADDEDLLSTALRETHEEIGVPPQAVDVLGALDDFRTVTNFSVTPFVAVIPYPFPYTPSPGEVESVVEVPLSFLHDPENLRMEERQHEGHVLDVLVWDFGRYKIWGATAQMLRNFLDLIPTAAPD